MNDTRFWGMALNRRKLFVPFNVQKFGGRIHRALGEGKQVTLCGRDWTGWGTTDGMVSCNSCYKVLQARAASRVSAPDAEWEAHILQPDEGPA